jgi:hypothetical protein
VLSVKALLPTAIFLSPVVLACKDKEPTAVLFSPVKLPNKV